MFDCRFGFCAKFQYRNLIPRSGHGKSSEKFRFEVLKLLRFSFSRFSLFLAVSSVPGGFKQLREVCRKIFHLFSSKAEAVWPTYDQKTVSIR